MVYDSRLGTLLLRFSNRQISSLSRTNFAYENQKPESVVVLNETSVADLATRIILSAEFTISDSRFISCLGNF